MVLSSRDRIPVSVEDRLALSAERRRLRFSFQINDVKDPTGLPAPPFYARWRRGAAYLVAAVFSVNRLLKLFQPLNGWVRLGRKNRPGPPRGFPLQSGTSRLRLGTLSVDVLNCKRVWTLSRFKIGPVPSEGRRIAPWFRPRNP